MTTSPDYLYHYTSAAGLIGIISNGSVWASDARFLNDSTELTVAQARFMEMLADKLPAIDNEEFSYVAGGGDMSLKDGEYSYRRNVVRATIKRLPTLTCYVTSFCQESDLLSQWRGYGEVGGYALGFDREALTNSLEPVERYYPPRMPMRLAVDGDVRRFKGSNFIPGPSLHPVVSDVQYVDRGDAGPLDAALRLVADRIAPAGMNELMKGAGFDLAEINALNGLAVIKDESFREEREVRIVVAEGDEGNPLRRFITTGNKIKPYINLPISLAALREIRVGPGRDIDERLMAVTTFLHQAGLSPSEVNPGVKVERSASPFRD